MQKIIEENGKKGLHKVWLRNSEDMQPTECKITGKSGNFFGVKLCICRVVQGLKGVCDILKHGHWSSYYVVMQLALIL